MQRALERLNRPQMQVLETLHLCTNADTGHSASAAMLKKLINGSSVAAVDRLLHSLQELALVHRADPPHGATPAAAKQRHYLPVGSLKDVIGIYPAGLGRSYTELVRLQPAFAQRVVQLVGELHRAGASISPATTPMEAALSLQHWTATPESLQQILATAPDRTAALLARFGNWAMGAVPQAQRRASVLHEGADVGPVDWLLARGLLVPLDAAHVELPHSVGVSLRGGFVIENFSLTPPVPRLGHTSAALRRNAALGAIAETLRLVGELLLHRARTAAGDAAQRRRRGPGDEAAGGFPADRTCTRPVSSRSSAEWPVCCAWTSTVPHGCSRRSWSGCRCRGRSSGCGWSTPGWPASAHRPSWASR